MSDFVFSFPVWTVVAAGKTTADGIVRAAFLHGEYLPIFTDDDLAKAGIEAFGVPSFEMAPIPDVAALKTILNGFESKGGKYVGIDVTGTDRAAGFYRIDAVLVALDEEGD